MRRISSKPLILILLLCLAFPAVAQQRLTPEGAVRYFYQNAFHYQSHNMPDTAMMCIDVALSIDSTFLPALNLKGYIYEEHYADYEQAMRCYQRILSLDSSYLKAYLNIGHLYYLKRQYREAKSHINKALAIDSTYADAYYNLGFIANEENYGHQALAYMNKAIALGSQAALKWMAWYEEQRRIGAEENIEQ